MSLIAERFEAAVRALVADGTLKQRLARAYAEYLADLQPAQLPAALRGSFAEIQTALSRLPPIGTENRVITNVQKMSPGEASGHASAIVRLYVELEIAVQGDRAEPLKVVSALKNPPRYLAQG
jgi:hypothetical protein